MLTIVKSEAIGMATIKKERLPLKRARPSSKGDLLVRYAGQHEERFLQFDHGFDDEYPPENPFASPAEHVSELRSHDNAYLRLQIRKRWLTKNEVLRMLDELRDVVIATDPKEFLDEQNGGTKFAERADHQEDMNDVPF